MPVEKNIEKKHLKKIEKNRFLAAKKSAQSVKSFDRLCSLRNIYMNVFFYYIDWYIFISIVYSSCLKSIYLSFISNIYLSIFQQEVHLLDFIFLDTPPPFKYNSGGGEITLNPIVQITCVNKDIEIKHKQTNMILHLCSILAKHPS